VEDDPVQPEPYRATDGRRVALRRLCGGFSPYFRRHGRPNATQTSTRGDVKNKETPDYFAHKLQTKEAHVKHLTTLRVMLKSREIGCVGGAGPEHAIGMPRTDPRGGVVALRRLSPPPPGG